MLILLILLVIGVLVAYRFLPEISKRRDQQARLDQLKAEVETERQDLARMTREEEFLKFDSEYASLFARDRLDLAKEGETIYRLEAPRMDPAKMRRIR